MFTLSVTTENAAFEANEREEIARCLRAVAIRLETTSQLDGGIMDLNGNRVGRWSLIGTENDR